MKKFGIMGILIMLLLLNPYPGIGSQPQHTVVIGEIKGVITPVIEAFIQRVLGRSIQENAQLVVFVLDTPGGLEESMRNIVKSFLQSSIPVVIYVSPQGARAASAGSFLLIASHHAFMSPNTTVGAAHPVTVEGQTVSEKIVNDAASFMRSLAETRRRNPEVAEKMVRESLSVTEKEALQYGLIDGVVGSVEEIFATLQIPNPQILRIPMNWKEKTLQYIVNPNLAYLFLTLGALGIIFELANPGAIIPGVFGGILVLLSFYAFSILPVNFVGILFIVLGFLFLILDLILIPGIGILSVGGIVSLLLGSLTLFNPEKGITVSGSLVATVIACIAGFFFILLMGVVRALRQKAKVGGETLIGKIGTAKGDLLPEGFIVVEGELWWAKSEEPVQQGEKVKILRKEGQTLVVKREG
ncbi:MAG: nodulation protein NfeD [Atribacterota bacterium]